MAGMMSRGPWNKCERGFCLSRLCRESLLTSCKPYTLEAVAGDCFYSRRLPHGECGFWGRAPRCRSLIEAQELRRRVRKATYSPKPLWDIKPVGEHLAYVVGRLSEYRTVACWHVSQGRDPVFARMVIDERF